ncbi:hypothetical protein LTR85_000046 [Meristemomyces frigidus]|nr:hypothetical protein LTR85_000046 [Meristemomyces frigidus]
MPDHLFRVWSDQSNGTNTPILFAPASVSSTNSANDASVEQAATGNIADQLKTAFLGQAAPANPFVFFTNTLLFALQLAAFKKAAGDTNIYISCIVVGTTKTTEGKSVVFRPAISMLKEHSVELKNRSDGSVREYEGVFVTTTSVYVGTGSLYIGYENLIKDGLFELYPELQAVTQRCEVRLQLTVSDLRKYWFATERPLTREKINTAAKLAAAFSPVIGGDVLDAVPAHLFASFLALQRRDINDPALAQCIDRRSTSKPETIDLTDDAEGAVSNAALPEVEQYEALMRFIAGREIHRSYLTAASAISPASIAKEVADWTTWHRQSRTDHRAARAEREGGEGGNRQPQGTDRYRKRREARGRNGLSVRPRVSREEYRASRPDRRGPPEGRRARDGRSRSPVRERRQPREEKGGPGRWR